MLADSTGQVPTVTLVRNNLQMNLNLSEGRGGNMAVRIPFCGGALTCNVYKLGANESKCTEVTGWLA